MAKLWQRIEQRLTNELQMELSSIKLIQLHNTDLHNPEDDRRNRTTVTDKITELCKNKK